MVPHGPTWYRMVPYGTVWYRTVRYGPIWWHIVPYGTVWSGMTSIFLFGPYGPVWPHMVPYGPVWSSIVPYGPVWFFMVPYGHVWSHMVPYGSVYSCMVPMVPYDRWNATRLCQKWIKELKESSFLINFLFLVNGEVVHASYLKEGHYSTNKDCWKFIITSILAR